MHAPWRSLTDCDAGAAFLVDGMFGVLEGDWMAEVRASLADLQLEPMMACVTAAPEGAAMLAGFPRLARWYARMRRGYGREWGDELRWLGRCGAELGGGVGNVSRLVEQSHAT